MGKLGKAMAVADAMTGGTVGDRLNSLCVAIENPPVPNFDELVFATLVPRLLPAVLSPDKWQNVALALSSLGVEEESADEVAHEHTNPKGGIEESDDDDEEWDPDA